MKGLQVCQSKIALPLAPLPCMGDISLFLPIADSFYTPVFCAALAPQRKRKDGYNGPTRTAIDFLSDPSYPFVFS